MSAKFQPIPGEAIAEHDPRIKLIAFNDIRLSTQRRDLVKGLIPREGLVVIWGEPKCGKSFWIFDLMMHVALGWKYRGRRIQQGSVVYCAFEGQHGFEARVEAFRQRHLPEQPNHIPFYLEPLTLDLVSDQQELIAAVRTQLRGAAPVAVVLDTLNRSIRGSESKDEDMAAYIAAADAIREAFQCVVIIVHHCGINGDRPRGHTSLTGAIDTQLAVKRDASCAVIVEVELAKDGPQGDKIVSRLEVVEVGLDEDGEPITSCVVVPSEANGTTPKSASGQAAVALKLLHRAMCDEGVPAPADRNIPTGQKTVVRMDAWKRYCANGIADDWTKRDSKQKAFKRAAQKLQEGGFIGVWGGFVWPTQESGQTGQ
jgi:hypothetical protein